MWISQITLKNFRPFYYDNKDAVTIKLDKESKTRFTVIEAKSDVGKTTLLSAMAWCLYGREALDFHGDSDGESVGPFSKTKSYEMKEGEVRSVEVEIVLNDSRNDKPLYEICRTQMFEKTKEGVEPHGESKLSINRWDGGDDMRTIDSEYLQMVINSILPEDIHLFFLFEGEKLEKHFAFSNTESISSAIEKTSQVKQLQTAITHLERVHDDVWTSSEGKVDSQVTAKKLEVDDLQIRLEDARKTLEENKRKLEEVTRDLQRLDDYLEKNDAVAVRERANRQRALEEANREIEEKLRELRSKYREKVVNNVPHAILAVTLSTLHGKLDEEKAKDELEPNIDNKYLAEILKQKKCVCGRSLDPKKHDDEGCIKLIKKKQDQNKLSDLRELFRDGRYEVDSLLVNLDEVFKAYLEAQSGRIEDKEKERVANQLEIDRISSEQKGLDDKDVVRVQSERDLLRTARDDQNRAIGRQELFIKVSEAELVTKRRELETLARKQAGNEERKLQADFIALAVKRFESIKDEILDEVRTRVQDRTWEYFRTLHWERAKYKSFTIDKNYKLQLLDANGTNWINDLASGPKQLLLLSFIAALSEVSGFKFPVFFDTPLANIDNEQRENVAKKLPDYLAGTQVILLMKDQEYTPHIKELLSERIWKEFHMTHAQGKTRVN
jgi:DNA sulfur modification protein DndD